MINWLRDLVIFIFWTYKEWNRLKDNQKEIKKAESTLNEVQKYINKEKEKENGK